MESDLFNKVQDTLAGALGIEISQITPEASLVKDLGAESIDFIDIIFRLEKAFDLKIPTGDLFPGNILNDERYVKEGKVTAEGLEALKVKLPYMDLQSFSRNPEVARLGDYFTVQMILDYLKDRLSKQTQNNS